MRIGKLHIHLLARRQQHTQTKWPEDHLDDSRWRTNYMETDTDCDEIEPGSPTEWTSIFDGSDGSIEIQRRAVTRLLIKFWIVYRSFWFEVGNCTKWRL